MCFFSSYLHLFLPSPPTLLPPLAQIMTTLTQTYFPSPSEPQRLGRRLPHIVGGAKFSAKTSKRESHAQFPSAASPTSPRRSFSTPAVSKLPGLSRKRESSDGSTKSKASSEVVGDDGAPLSITRSRSAPVVPNASTIAAQPAEDQQASGSRASTPTSGKTLTFPHVANLFVKLRRVQRKSKAHHIDSNSGIELLTHESLKQLPPASPTQATNDGGAGSGTDSETLFKRLARLEILDVYNCADGVDVDKVLRASRNALLEHAGPLRANVLVDEQ